jgi:membrane protein YqaA with SNARE-associated domain
MKQKTASRHRHPTVSRRPNIWINLLRLAVLLVVIVFSVFVFTIRDEAGRLAAYGFPGIFVVSLLANATLLLPAPGIAVVFAMGSVLHPFLVALAAGAGAAIGELTGYAAGFSGQAVLERSSIYARVIPYVQRYGGWTILAMAAVPNPFFDLVGVAAGALKIKLHRFLLWCLLGETIKMLIFAYTGAYSIDWLVNLLK